MEQVSQELGIDLAIRIANARAAWMCTVAVLLQRGLITEADVEWMRDHCVETAAGFASSGSETRREFGLAGMRDMIALFRGVLPD